MIAVLPVSAGINSKLKMHGIEKKFYKQCILLSQNPAHPSLHLELLEPKTQGIYSFRIDRKYRALFFFHPSKIAVEIIAVTVHYR